MEGDAYQLSIGCGFSDGSPDTGTSFQADGLGDLEKEYTPLTVMASYSIDMTHFLRYKLTIKNIPKNLFQRKFCCHSNNDYNRAVETIRFFYKLIEFLLSVS